MIAVRAVVAGLALSFVLSPGVVAAEGAASTPPAAAPEAAANDQLQALVEFVTDRKSHPIAENNAEKTLSRFGQVTRSQDTPEICDFSAVARPDLYAAVGFSKDAEGKWADPQFAFYLFESKDLDQIFTTLNRSITEKLGKPWKTKKAKGKMVNAVWNFKKPLKVWLSRVVETGPGHSTPVDHIELLVGKAEEEVKD